MMYRNMTPVDVSKVPSLLGLAEEVYRTKKPRVLKRYDESIAIVMPLATVLPKQRDDIWKNYDAKRVQKALKESAGALTGVNRKTLLHDISEQRSQKAHSHSV